jgi:predicted HD phosphohydrolase
MTEAEVRAYEALPFAQEAARLRRYDDIGKVPGAETPGLEHYCGCLEAALLHESKT